jgi:hypothetical protein
MSHLRTDKSASCGAELAWARSVTVKHITSPGRHANFNVQGLGKRDDTKEEHDEE